MESKFIMMNLCMMVLLKNGFISCLTSLGTFRVSPCQCPKHTFLLVRNSSNACRIATVLLSHTQQELRDI